MLDSLDTLISFALIMLVVSLIITVCVQMLASALNLRGWNLAKGLGEAFQTAVPGIDDKAKELAAHILRGPLLSDSSFKHWPSRWRIGTAVRTDEVFDAIHQIATGRRAAPAELIGAARNLLLGLGVNHKQLAEAAKQMSDARATVAEASAAAHAGIAAISDDDLRQKAERAVADLGRELESYAVAEADRMAASSAAVAQSLEQAYERFRYWCEIAQERVGQWFTLHMRLITVCFAILFALVLQLDTVETFKLVSSNRSLRDKLVAQSTAAAAQAQKVFEQSNGVLAAGYDAWRATQPAAVQNAVASVVVEPNDTRESLLRRLANTLPDSVDRRAALVSFNETLDRTARTKLKEAAGHYAVLRDDFENTGFDLFPRSGGGRWGERWSDGWRNHVVGVLFSVCLLSLGAPFWYNTLKGLTSLRSIVAQNISDEKKQERIGPERDRAARVPPPLMPTQ